MVLFRNNRVFALKLRALHASPWGNFVWTVCHGSSGMRISKHLSRQFVWIRLRPDESQHRSTRATGVHHDAYLQVSHAGLAHGRADRFDGRLDAGQKLRQVSGGRRHFLLFGQHEPRQRHAVRVERRWLVFLLLRHLRDVWATEPAQKRVGTEPVNTVYTKKHRNAQTLFEVFNERIRNPIFFFFFFFLLGRSHSRFLNFVKICWQKQKYLSRYNLWNFEIELLPASLPSNENERPKYSNVSGIVNNWESMNRIKSLSIEYFELLRTELRQLRA